MEADAALVTRDPPRRGPAGGSSAGRRNAPELTRADILQAATREFSEKGLSGARIDAIAERTRTSKRMIYYYFESKEGLYRAVLEESYRQLHELQSKLDLEAKPPLEALAQHVRFTFDYQLTNTDFIRLVMVENIHHGEHLAQLSNTQRENMSTIEGLRKIVRRGVAAGVMRHDLDPVELHMRITALCFFNVANRHTFSTIFKLDMASPAATVARRESVTAMVLRYVAP